MSYATAFPAVMEAPAILVGVVLGKLAANKKGDGSLKVAIHETLLGRSIFLLAGALVVGALCGEVGMKQVEPLFVAPFQGVLAFFLLEMGVVAGKRMGDLKKAGLAHPRQWGGCWLALELWNRLDLDAFWQPLLADSQKGTP